MCKVCGKCHTASTVLPYCNSSVANCPRDSSRGKKAWIKITKGARRLVPPMSLPLSLSVGASDTSISKLRQGSYPHNTEAIDMTVQNLRPGAPIRPWGTSSSVHD